MRLPNVGRVTEEHREMLKIEVESDAATLPTFAELRELGINRVNLTLKEGAKPKLLVFCETQAQMLKFLSYSSGGELREEPRLVKKA